MVNYKHVLERDWRLGKPVNASFLQIRRSDLTLPQAEYVYNMLPIRTTRKIPSQIVYGRNPFTPLHLVPIPVKEHLSMDVEEHSKKIKDLHQEVRDKIMCSNKRYSALANKHHKRVVFQEGDLVWIHLRKERFPTGRFGKLKPQADGPFRVQKKIYDNAYKIELPGHYNLCATFNVLDLSPYLGENEDDLCLNLG
ncbi:RNA-directed DNA polymerase [Tanacetum coccineum]|uniref:RNA-directed DNA polymerase n=1 Tax=Tanacetum coccineum TaxID=301880 RepID=A0ABQ5AE13_9ASTR